MGFQLAQLRTLGRCSECLLKISISLPAAICALYSVRSERLFCEQLSCNHLWLWFLDREFSQGSFDPSIFAKSYQRVLSADVAKLFFAEVYDLSPQKGWTSDTHFTADGTLIESRASLKSIVRKDGGEDKKVRDAKDDDPGNPTVNFHGEKRCNDIGSSLGSSRLWAWRKPRAVSLNNEMRLLPASSEFADVTFPGKVLRQWRCHDRTRST
jgi:hypothetical protein